MKLAGMRQHKFTLIVIILFLRSQSFFGWISQLFHSVYIKQNCSLFTARLFCVAIHMLNTKFYFFRIVAVLLKKGVNISVKDQNDDTPLHLAAKGDHLEVVTLLIDHHADIDPLK